MADTDPVHFSMSAARQIRESVRVTQRLGQNERGRGRRWPLPEDPLPGMVRVHFEIEVYDEYTGLAMCGITYRPCGMASVPDEEGGIIYVSDPAGCYFNEPADDLLGRKGHADYMQPASDDVDPYQSCLWIVSGLCCP